MTRGAEAPRFAPASRLDIEAEIGAIIGKSNALGESIPLGEAEDHLFGLCIVNDWSARDLQGWEMAPLGPFLSKNFLTTISPWVVTLDALEPFRIPAAPRIDGAPPLLPYLDHPEDSQRGGLAIDVEIMLATEAMRAAGDAPERIAIAPFGGQYWTIFQMLAHHSVNGCNLRSGDLLGSGTISGPMRAEFGSLMEITDNGSLPLKLANGEERTFLEDGDEVVLRARCAREGFAPIGFGECRGLVVH
jgi:fumarylacetoacetase